MNGINVSFFNRPSITGIPDLPNKLSPTKKIVIVALGVLFGVSCGLAATCLCIGLITPIEIGVLCAITISTLFAKVFKHKASDFSKAKTAESYLNLLDNETPINVTYEARYYVKGILNNPVLTQPGKIKIKLENSEEITVTSDNETELPLLSSFTFNDELLFKKNSNEGEVSKLCSEFLGCINEEQEKEKKELSKQMLKDQMIVQGIYESCYAKLQDVKLTTNVLRYTAQVTAAGLATSIFARYINTDLGFHVQGSGIDFQLTDRPDGKIELKLTTIFRLFNPSDNKTIKNIARMRKIVISRDELVHDLNRNPEFFNPFVAKCLVTDSVSFV